MKQFFILLICVIGITNIGSSQSYYRPLSFEELYIEALAKAEYQKQQKERFEHYQQIAYNYYNKKDWNGFLTYSQCALDCGWYNSRLYYDRGVAYEMQNDFKHAKKEYKKAKKKGYAYAESALQSMKLKEKDYKQRLKQNKRKQ